MHNNSYKHQIGILFITGSTLVKLLCWNSGTFSHSCLESHSFQCTEISTKKGETLTFHYNPFLHEEAVVLTISFTTLIPSPLHRVRSPMNADASNTNMCNTSFKICFVKSSHSQIEKLVPCQLSGQKQWSLYRGLSRSHFLIRARAHATWALLIGEL